jgi:RNA polymerase sigma factor (sigma-70 family)
MTGKNRGGPNKADHEHIMSRHPARLVGFVNTTRPAASGDEWQTVQRAIAGDSNELSTLFAQYRARLYRAAFSILRNPEDAEDALQDGLLSACLHLRDFEGRSCFSTWLTRIVLNAALMVRRRLRARPQTSLEQLSTVSGSSAESWVVDAKPNPEQTYALAERRDLLLKGMMRLSPHLRSPLQLHYFHCLSLPDVAKRQGVGINVLKSRNWRARHQLAGILPLRQHDQAGPF